MIVNPISYLFLLTLLLLGLFCSYAHIPEIAVKDTIPSVMEPTYHAIKQKQWREYDSNGQGYDQLTEDEWLHIPWMKKGIEEMTEAHAYQKGFAAFS